MFFFAIDIFFVIVYDFAFVEKMIVSAKITFDVIATNFVNMIVFLTMKVLFDFAFFFEVIAYFIKIIVQQLIFDSTIRRFRVNEFDNKKRVFFFILFVFFCSCYFYDVVFYIN